MSEQLTAVIYTQPYCGPCRMVEQFLEDNAVPFVTRDVTKDPVALNDLVERGFMATPVTHIGVQWIAGSTGTNQVRRSRSAKEKLHVSEIQSYEELTRPIRERAAQRSDPERQAHLQDLFAGLEREQAQQAPAIGDRAPDFTLQEAGTGSTVQLSDAVTRGPVVLSFYRGQWCPFCNLEVRALQSI
ncbi:MAG: glutaredoxin domain-containing protein, partial [Dehalococcoidia bacterium]